MHLHQLIQPVDDSDEDDEVIPEYKEPNFNENDNQEDDDDDPLDILLDKNDDNNNEIVDESNSTE